MASTATYLRLLLFFSLAIIETACLSMPPSPTTWSETAIKFANDLSVSQREKLLAEQGGMEDVEPRPIRIQAERLDLSSSIEEWMNGDKDNDSNDGADDGTVIATKIVHFQRHGQGYHNLLGEILRDAGVQPDIDSFDPTINPWIRPEIIDSPLTETGKRQCQEQRAIASTLNPELVIVSPLARAVQTAQISFADFYSSSCNNNNDNGQTDSTATIPWIAHEGCREDLGVLTCNKRRPLSEIAAEFPELVFHEIAEEDTLWHPSERESHQSKGERAYDFLAHFVAKRPEHSIAVVAHSAWLFHCLNAIVDCGQDEDLSSWFLTSEIRSMKLTFTKNQEQ